MEHKGGCLCGAVRFAVVGAPRAVFHCHCFSCRRQTGAALASFAAFLIMPSRFHWAGVPPSRYHSSPGVTRTFCAKCGTPIGYQAEKYPDEIHLNIGTLDRPQDFVPSAHYHVAEKIAWLELADHLPRHHRDSSAAVAEEQWGADEA